MKEKCHKIAKYVRLSEARNNELKVVCKKTNTSYKLPVKQNATRWNSVQMNIEYVLHLTDPLQYLANCDEVDLDEKVSTRQEFKVSESVHKV